MTAVDVIVCVVLITLTVLVILLLLPRGREHARMASCQRNLAHIGFALAQYDLLEHALPTVFELARPDPPGPFRPKGPLLVLLETLVQPNFLGITDAKSPLAPHAGEVPGEIPVPGFTCASDSSATAGHFAAPISYRACTGDTPLGETGAFRVGRKISLQEIQDRDGLSFTAAFSERLAGDNLANHPAACNYALCEGPLTGAACPLQKGSAEWRGDAGSSWVSSDYRSTLYNHALAPGGQPSCIDNAGRTAFMGASSGHVSGINLLLMDGHVMVVTRSIDPKIWRDFARIGTVPSTDD